MTKNGEIMALEGALTVQQWLVLLQIDNTPGFPRQARDSNASAPGVLASDIATDRGVSRASISALIASLLRKRLVRQVEDPSDRRRKFLSITSRGQKALEKIEPLRRSVNTTLFADFTAEEMQTVHRFLQRSLEKLWHIKAKRET
jgi:DNA-binding MarR family transcriptional regulator